MEASKNEQNVSIKASDLRGILEYVPLYRNQTFVVAIDGSIIDCDNFGNVITDIAVLRSLNINVVVVYGIGKQLRDAGNARGIQLTDIYGSNPVDDKTLALARETSANALQTIIDAFATVRCHKRRARHGSRNNIGSRLSERGAHRKNRL